MDFRILHGNHQEVGIEQSNLDHGQDSLVPIQTVVVNLNRLPADQVVEVITGLLPVGLARRAVVVKTRTRRCRGTDAELIALNGDCLSVPLSETR